MFGCTWNRRLLIAAVLAAITGMRAEAQDKVAGSRIRSATRVVAANVVVTDRQGNLIRDLDEGDFAILDGGRPQKIAFFSKVDNEQAPTTNPPTDRDAYGNDLVAQGAPPSVTILLFDTLNAQWTSQSYGLQRVRKFLRQIKAEDRIGIYVLGDELKVIHESTRDSSDLLAAIRRYDEPADSKARAGGGEDALGRFLAGGENRYRFAIQNRPLAGIGQPANAAQRRAQLVRANQITTAALKLIARELSSFPGRKSLIWVSDDGGSLNFLADDELDEYLQLWRDEAHLKVAAGAIYQNKGDIEDMVRLMNDAGIAVYTVDARGLETFDLGFLSEPNSAPIGSPAEPVNELAGRTPQAKTSMLELANRTGGRAFFNRNDVETGIRRALDDARFTYELAYYPDHNQWKGEWRKIQVKVNRPEVTVLARGGYFALPDPRPGSPRDRYEFLGQIAASPIEATQLPLRVHVAALPSAQGPQIEARVHLSPRSMLAQQNGGRWKGSFEVVFLQIGEKNRLLDVTQKEVDGDLDAKEYGAVSTKGWDLGAQLSFMAGAKTLCVIVRDKSSDAVGSVHIPLSGYAAAAAPR